MRVLPTHDDRDFQPAPVGLWPAVCVDVVDLGWQEPPQDTNWGWYPKIRIVWQLAETFKDEEGKERRFIVGKKVTLSISSKSTLRPLIESWFSKKLDDDVVEKAGGLELDKFIDKPCALTITHEEYQKEGKTKVWANVSAVSPLAQGMASVVHDGEYKRKQDRDDWEAPNPSAGEPRLAEVYEPPTGTGEKEEPPASDPEFDADIPF